ncbi:DUF262 domain-containing protein [Myroides odoratimimus]|uniref:GmrSD restriction endonuclease domain-containing protein n=1 Tax=Myroides odoratimimus TaxID=76832 RepID=UPI0025765A59|nr:DUF262 domain-containing protein [Myroides odoratimimus]MDM1098285.1 DUF262 domain-containing protein [Myroides odoratimimus]MDM1410738.1 DUF262 domain-containing protein [Myroides odoratimimus]MEC4007680.1 DUF262 domain-containing protein [Myroides odoratimimus]
MIIKYTFHQLLVNHIIEVPIIQRDYAQGRLSDNVNYIRERFVKSLVNNIVQKEDLHLGFIYGKIEGKERQREAKLHQDSVKTLLHTVTQYAHQFNIDVKTKININEIDETSSLIFIPLDGQQRLTTLFLLYWYISMRKGEISKELLNFRYNNRKLALAFFEELTTKGNIEVIHKELSEELDKQITKYTWYLDKWKYDATVSGALVMLQAIHKEFSTHKEFDFMSINLKDLPFKFDFLDLDNLRQSDELYIKMNERGKQLTDFEHFKAWLQDCMDKKQLSVDDKAFLERFWKKIDTDWLNFFWKKIDADFRSLDDFYFNYLKTLAINFHLSTSKNTTLPNHLKELLQKIRNSDTYDKQSVKYIPLSQFIIELKNDSGILEIFELFSIDCLRYIDSTISTLIGVEEDIKYKINSIVKEPFISKGKNILSLYLNNNAFTPNYWDQVYYYFILELLKSNKINLDFWIRSMRNIIYNTYIQNPDNVFDALKSIGTLLSSDILDLEEALKSEKFSLSFFDKSQITEERYKCTLDPTVWDFNKIHKFEDHEYFMGQIQFAFDLATGDKDLFTKYSDLLSELFSTRNNEIYLQQALLTKGDYLVERTNHSFCRISYDSLRSRNDNWRQIFDDEKRRNLLGSLLDNLLDLSDLDLVNKLKTIIKNHKFTKEDWEYYFVENGGAIKECKYNEIRWFSANDVRLLHSTAITGYHLELRTMWLFQELENLKFDINPFETKEYLWDKNTGGSPGIKLSSFKLGEKVYDLDIRFSKDGAGYECYFFHKAATINDRSADEIVIKALGDFIYDDEYKHYFKKVDKEKMIEYLSILTSKLSTL